MCPVYTYSADGGAGCSHELTSCLHAGSRTCLSVCLSVCVCLCVDRSGTWPTSESVPSRRSPTTAERAQCDQFKLRPSTETARL